MMDKITIKDGTSIEELAKLTANKVNELVEGYNEIMKLFSDSVIPGNHQINNDK